MTLLIFYLLLALVVSFFCSLLEAVLLSITPSYIESKMAAGKPWAPRLVAFKKNIDRPLAAILSLNTIAHTVGAAGVGAQAVLVFSNVSVGVISGILTLVILVFSEIIPKTVGARYWKSLTFFTTMSLRTLLILMYPFVLLSQLITKLMKTDNEPTVERSEVIALAEIGRREGVFTEHEARILQNLVKLRSVSVRDIMTPRTVMVVAHEDMTLGEFSEDDRFYRVSRIPLYVKNKDNIRGFVHKNDVLTKLSRGERDLTLKDLAREITVVPDNQNIYKLYSHLVEANNHIALVVEEFGGTAGLVTMEDVLETLLGLEITDEFDHNKDLREYARNRWRERARRMGIQAEGEESEDRQEQPD